MLVCVPLNARSAISVQEFLKSSANDSNRKSKVPMAPATRGLKGLMKKMGSLNARHEALVRRVDELEVITLLLGYCCWATLVLCIGVHRWVADNSRLWAVCNADDLVIKPGSGLDVGVSSGLVMFAESFFSCKDLLHT